MTAASLIECYGLQPHPEGGFYKETYRSSEHIPGSALPGRFSGKRYFSTAIYFLLNGDNFSAFHRIKSDELWHFYAGVALHIHVIDHSGNWQTIRLGSDIAHGEVFQAVVPAGCWFASEPSVKDGFSFVGCTVAPGFDFSDFELADAGQLSTEFPVYAPGIRRLCR